VISGTDLERSKLIHVQKHNSRRNEFELEMDEKVLEKKCPVPKIFCVKGVRGKELTWNERAQRVYFYLHPELGNKKMSILLWAYPSLLENT